jgi:hypothetical protein
VPKVSNVELYCPYCTNRLEADISYRGHQISCQGCGQLIVVPANAKVVTKKFSLSILIGLVAIGVAILVVAITINADPPKDRSEKREPTVAYDQASSEQRNHISSALGDKYTVHECRVIENRDQYEGYFLAARFSYEGIEKHEKVVGVWWIGGAKNKPTLLASINEPAYTHSRMGWASKSKRGYTMATPAAKELYEALTK